VAGSKVSGIKRLYGERFMVDESLWEGRAPGRPFGLEGRNRPLKFRLLHVIEFTPDGGQIQREQVWLDMAAIFQQLPQEGAFVAKRTAKPAPANQRRRTRKDLPGAAA